MKYLILCTLLLSGCTTVMPKEGCYFQPAPVGCGAGYSPTSMGGEGMLCCPARMEKQPYPKGP